MFILRDGRYSVKCPRCSWKSESFPSEVVLDALDLFTKDLKLHIRHRHFFYFLYVRNVTRSLHARITPDGK